MQIWGEGIERGKKEQKCKVSELEECLANSWHSKDDNLAREEKVEEIFKKSLRKAKVRGERVYYVELQK